MAIDMEDFEIAFGERFADIVDRRPIIPPNTPRDLAQCVVAVRRLSDSRVAVTARAFFRVRALLSSQLEIDAKTILPGSRLSDLMPDLATRRADWERLGAKLAVRHAPRLVRSTALAWMLAIGGGALFLGTLVSALVLAPSHFLLTATAVSGVGMWAGLRITRPWARHFQPRDLTVGSLVHFVVSYGLRILDDLAQPASRTQVLEVIQALVRLEIGAPIVDPDATWEELDALARAS